MLRKLNKILLLFYVGVVIATCDCIEEDVVLTQQNVLKENTLNPNEGPSEMYMENAIKEVESQAANLKQETDDFSEDFDKIYDSMIAAVDNIHKEIKNPDNIFKFIKANGFSRILSNNLMNEHSELRTKLLLLLKDMFDTAPNFLDALLPIKLIDVLLDIFETDDNLAIKAHAIDILYKWLPKNPKAQVRVMKVKGLEAFYNQLDKLDVGVIKTLMELFNKILEEHLEVRNDKAQVARDDGKRLVMYQRIGLLERMSTPTVCNGLINIFATLWTYNNNQSDNIKIVLDLIKNAKPFCLKIITKKPKAKELFQQLLKLLKDEDRKEYFEQHDVNVTDAVMVVEQFLVQKNSGAKDEL